MQAIFKIGSERVGQGDVGKGHLLGDRPWQQLQLAIESPWSAPREGDIFIVPAHTSLEKHSFHLVEAPFLALYIGSPEKHCLVGGP